MQLQDSLWRENLKYSNNHKFQVNVLNANRKIARHTKNKFGARFSQRFNTFDFCTETCCYWWLPVNLPCLGISSDGAGRKTPLGLGFPACSGWSRSRTGHAPGGLTQGDQLRLVFYSTHLHSILLAVITSVQTHTLCQLQSISSLSIAAIPTLSADFVSWFLQVRIYRLPLLLQQCFSKTKTYGMMRCSCT